MDWKFFALGSAFFAALTAIFGKIGVAEMNSNLATFFRTVVILIVAAAFVSFQNEWRLPQNVSAKGLAFLVLSGVTTGLSWLCYYRALQQAPASQVAPLDKLSVVLVIAFAMLFLGERLSWKSGLGAILISTGTVLLVL